MKRLFACLLLITVLALTFSLFVSPATAAAEDESYLEITRDNVCLYENTVVQDALFVIPRTFYVKIVKANITPVYHEVEYNGIKGLIKINEVSSTPVLNVENPYYTATNISSHINCNLYSKPSFSAETSIAAYGLTLPYLGKTSGEKGTYGTSTWFAVSYSGQVYYIHASMTENLDLLEATFAPVHPNSVEKSESTPTGASTGATGAKQAEEGVDIVRILLIVGMIVPIVIILIVLFGPRKKPKDD